MFFFAIFIIVIIFQLFIMKLKKQKSCRFIFFSFALAASVFFLAAEKSQAQIQKSFFENHELQKILQKIYHLEDANSKTIYPLEIEKFSQTKIKFIQDAKYVSEIENGPVCQGDMENTAYCKITGSFLEKFHTKKTGQLLLNREKITEYLDEIAKKINTDPVNGKLEVGANGKIRVLALSKNGYHLDAEKSFEKIKETLVNNAENKKIALAIEEIEPEITTENVEAMGIVEKIGEGESNFAGSPKNRIHNIHVGVSKFHGLILDKGEEFSFVKYLGAVDAENGYKPELVIKNNETIPEFGGGICQVSTTMFRAAYNTGFEITERKNHAYPVQYYSPQGTDATVYIPRPDLKFVNNTPAKILIQGKIEGTILTFSFYGTDDGREVEIEGPIVTKRTPNNQFYTVLYQRVKSKDGELIIDKAFKSFYDDPAKYHPEAEPEHTEKPDKWSDNEWDEYKKEHGM